MLTYLDVYHTFSDGGYSCNDPFPRLELFSEMSGSLKEVVWERNYNKTKMQVRRRRGEGEGAYKSPKETLWERARARWAWIMLSRPVFSAV